MDFYTVWHGFCYSRARACVICNELKLETKVYIGFVPIKIICELQENNGFVYIIESWQQETA